MNVHRLLIELVANVMTHVFEDSNTGAYHLQLIILRLDN